MDQQKPFIERLVVFLVPTLRIPRRAWRTPWDQREQKAFVLGARLFFAAWFATYTAHFFLIDVPLQKEPLLLWALYRFSLAGISLIGFAMSFHKGFMGSRYFRLPVAVIGLIFAAMQAQSMVWRHEVPYFYSILVPVIAAIAIRKSVFESLLYLAFAYALSANGWLSRPAEMPYILSAAIVGAIVVVILRSRMSADIDAFISEQQRLEIHAALIESQQELNEQIRAFLPKEIYRRITDLMQKERKSVLQAMDEVLRPRETLVACLHSDIRGYTHATKSLREFVATSAIPHQKITTEIVESHRGIPKLAGDLVFAYFDSYDPVESFYASIRCAFALTQRYSELNEQAPQKQKVHRYVLLSFGRAVVGNIGGMDGSREITALGDPANILSRIDPLTKTKAVKSLLAVPSIILNREAHELMIKMFPKVSVQRINLEELGLKMRDFREETILFAVPVCTSNEQEVRTNGNLSAGRAFLSEVYDLAAQHQAKAAA